MLRVNRQNIESIIKVKLFYKTVTSLKEVHAINLN